MNETGSDGSSRLIPLTKCTNAFTCDYEFRAGTFHYQLQGVDINGVAFTYNLNKSAVIRADPSLYILRSTNTTGITVYHSRHFTAEFELQSNDSIGSTNFSLSAAAEGFTITLDSPRVQLLPKQARRIILTGRVHSTVGAGTSHHLTITARNGCVTLTASRMVVVRAMVSNGDSVYSL